MAISLNKLYFNDPSQGARRLRWHVLSVGPAPRGEPERHESSDKLGAFHFWIISGCGKPELEPGTVRLELEARSRFLDLRKPRTTLPSAGNPLTMVGSCFVNSSLEVWPEQRGDESEFLLEKLGGVTQIRRTENLPVDFVTRRPSDYKREACRLTNERWGTLLHAKRMRLEPASEVSGWGTRGFQAVLTVPARAWKARDLAAVAGVGYPKLRELFKQSQQETLPEFLQRKQLEQARFLLCGPQLTFKEVAGQLSFFSEFYFSHFFEKPPA